MAIALLEDIQRTLRHLATPRFIIKPHTHYLAVASEWKLGHTSSIDYGIIFYEGIEAAVLTYGSSSSSFTSHQLKRCVLFHLL